MMKTYMKKTRGMTLIEVIVWITVFLAVMWAIVGSILSFYRTNEYTLEQAEAVSEARHSIESIVKTIREANYSSQGAYPVISMSTSSFSFYADIDNDSLYELVRFYLSGSNLLRDVVHPSGDPPVYTAATTTSTVARYVRNNMLTVPVFSYYSATGTQITNMSRVQDVRFVRVDTVVNVNVSTTPDALTVQSSATLRNLRRI